MNKIILLSFPLFYLISCATPKTAVNPRADFSKIKRVAVLSFQGSKGEVAADMLTQSLLQYGADVVERQRLEDVLREQNLSMDNMLSPSTARRVGKILGVDAVFVGSVIDVKNNSTYIAQTNASNPQNTINKISGKTIYSGGSVAGLADSQILSTTAEVALSARMVDVETASVMWSAYMSYEGFDMASAMSSISEFFIKSLVPIWPELKK
ncbi:MAG: CsgG/HfaB family protein [Elusimicrobiota bacterium]